MPHTGVDLFAFSAKAWSHTAPAPHYMPFLTHCFLHCSICFCKAALKKKQDKQTGNDLGFISTGLFSTWIFSLVLFMVQLHKKDASAQARRQRAAVRGRMSGQRQGALKKEHKKLLHLSNE